MPRLLPGEAPAPGAPPQVSPPPDPQAAGPSDYFRRLDLVEQASGGTLPSDVALSLANFAEDQLHRAAVSVARHLDIVPLYLMGQGHGINAYTNPLTGGPLTFGSARRLFKPFEVSTVAPILAKMTEAHPAGAGIRLVGGDFPRLRHYPGTDAVDPNSVVAAIKAMGPIEGDSLPWTTALGVAVQLARSNVDLGTLRENLAVATRVMKPEDALAVALEATQRGRRFQGVQDVGIMLAPGAAEPLLKAAALRSQATFTTRQHEAQRTPGEAPLISQAVARGLAGVSPSEQSALDVLDPFFSEKHKDTVRDFRKTSLEIAKLYDTEDRDFSETWLGKALAPVGDFLGKIQKEVQADLYLGRKALLAPIDIPIQVAKGGVGGYLRGWAEETDVATRIENGRTTIGAETVEQLHLPKWAGIPLDLYLAFETDPLILAGKGFQVSRANKLLFELPGARGGMKAPDVLGAALPEGRTAEDVLNSSKMLRSIRDFWTKPVLRLGRKSVAEALWEQAVREKNPERYYDAMVGRFRGYRTGANALDRPTMALIFDYVKASKGVESKAAQIEKIVQMGTASMGAEWGAKGLGNSLIRSRAILERRAADEFSQQMYDRYGDPRAAGIAQQVTNETVEVARTESDDWLSSIFDDMELSFLTGPRPMFGTTVEIPHFQVSTDLLKTLRAVGLADTGPGRATAQIFNRVPRGVADIEGLNGQTPWEQMRYYLRRGGVHSNQEIARYEHLMARAVDRLNPNRTQAWMGLWRKAEKDTLERISRRAKVDPALVERAVAQHSGLVDESSRLINQSQLFGVAGEERAGFLHGQFATEPIATTQTLNELAVMDPVLMERAIRGNVTSIRRYTNMLRQATGVPFKVADPKGLAQALGLERAWYGWKRLVVTRPAYVLRVPLLDENLRFFATLGWLPRLEGTKTGARLLSIADRYLGTGRALAARIESEGGGITDQVIHYRRPGLLPNQPAVNTDAARRALGESMAEETRRSVGILKDTGSFKGIRRGEAGYFSSWEHDLNLQFGPDPVTGRIVRDVAEGRPMEESVRGLRAYLTEDPYGKRFASQLGITPENLNYKVEQIATIVRRYTAEDPAIARAALSGQVDKNLLEQIDANRMPVQIHGPEVLITQSRNNVFRRFFHGWSRWILEVPTNVLNRQPYYKSWFDTATRGAERLAASQGRVLTDEVRAQIRVNADRFARDQVRRIMFDFRDQGRLGEMMRFVAPFFQPWAEAFIVWGRIFRQNPAIIGWAEQALHQAQESGFLRRDPETGELIVPMSNWMGAATILHAAFGGHWELSAPLSGFNLFFNSAFPLPTGALASDVPLPLPGFSPPAQLAIQKLIDHADLPLGVKLKLQSWAYQYGGVGLSAAIPRWMYYAMQSLNVFNPTADNPFVKATADDFLRLQQAMGVRERDDEPPPGFTGNQWRTMATEERHAAWKDYLVRNAQMHAYEFMGLRSFFSLFFPAAPRITPPTQPYSDELRKLTDRLGFEKGNEEFLTRHPNLSLMTVPNTMWSRQLSAVSIPATKATSAIMQLPGFKDFAHRHPQWVWAIIPKEARDGKFDLGTYYQQIASGLREVLTPEEVLTQGDVSAGWDVYFAHRAQHDAILDSLDAKGIGQGDPPYEAEMARYRGQIADIKRVHPDWSASYDTFSTRSVDPQAMAWARKLVDEPLYAGTDAGKWTKGYLSLTDDIFAEMRAHNIRTLNTKAAKDLGLLQRYQQGVKDLNQQYPDGRILYRTYFSTDLQGPATAGDRALLDLTPTERTQVTEQWSKWQATLDGPTTVDPGPDKVAAFLAIRDEANSAFEGPGPNWLKLWWKGLDPNEKKDYREKLMGRPYEFWSRFDRGVMREKTTASAEGYWLQLGQDVQKIAEFHAQAPELPQSPLYDALDQQVRAWASSDPVFAQQIAHANTWGYAVSKLIPEVQSGSDSQPYWGSFLDALGKVQTVADNPVGVDSVGNPIFLHGPDVDVDPAKKALWIKLKQSLEGWRDHLFAESPQFEREWTRLEHINGYDSLIDYFMPNTYFPSGGYPVIVSGASIGSGGPVPGGAAPARRETRTPTLGGT